MPHYFLIFLATSCDLQVRQLLQPLHGVEGKYQRALISVAASCGFKPYNAEVLQLGQQ
jgi:hypothetical protein